MGDAAVSALVKDVLGRLTSLVVQEFGLLHGFKDDILRLKEDFDRIQAVLQDAGEKRVKNNAIELWLKSLRSASLMVENVLDEVSTEALLQHLHRKIGIKYVVRAFFSSDHNQLLFRIRIAHKVKAIRRELDVIASKRFELRLNPVSHVDDMGDVGKMPERETSSLIHSSINIFGRNKEMKMVTRTICNKDIGKFSNGEIRVYGIWGMGGVGKTTLAQLVYNHEMVTKYFDLKCWVYVSENFQVKEIMRKIIESIDKCGCTLTQLETFQESLQSKLGGKKFLIVLDDVWIEYNERTKWDQLSETLSCGAEGSIVVITTRSDTTTRMVAKVPELQHQLGCLSEEDSWLLFKKLAFAEGRQGDDISELEPIGREIVDKCKGLPLAVKTLGSLMWSKSSTSDWQRVKDSNIWELPENNILSALKLSYDNLPPHVKRCFAYCCLFPKGYEMEKDELIQLWIANSFISPRGKIDLYVLGEEVFNCLVWRSFVSKVKKLLHSKFTNDDWVDRYIMHDLMHDMARNVMGDDFLVIEPPDKKVKIPNEVLHLSSSCPSKDLEKFLSLRSIFMFGKRYKYNPGQNFNHVYLRVLYMVGIELNTLAQSVCKLKHLKYLKLSNSYIDVIPESIIYLQNLQVLNLYRCEKLRKLPKGLRYMSNLQHLNIAGCILLEHLPFGIKELTSLRTLSKFPVGTKGAAQIGELGNLNLLEGELEIHLIDDVGGSTEAKSANLKCKKYLSALELRWPGIYKIHKPELIALHEDVLEGLEPNPCLKSLDITYYVGKMISPSWMVKLRNLVRIVFYSCYNCEYISTLGRLPNLRFIKFVTMDSLKSFHENDKNMLGDTSNVFLSLEDLDISYCPSLVSLPRCLPKLKVLRLKKCNGLLSLPDEIQSFKDLNELKITGCRHLSKRCEKDTGADWPKISRIPQVSIYPSWDDLYTKKKCYVTGNEVEDFMMTGNEVEDEDEIIETDE